MDLAHLQRQAGLGGRRLGRRRSVRPVTLRTDLARDRKAKAFEPLVQLLCPAPPHCLKARGTGQEEQQQ